MLNIQISEVDQLTHNHINDFINSKKPKYIMGRNLRAKAVSQLIDVDGFVDDFSNESIFLQKPIYKSNELPSESLVLVTSICNPFSAQNSLSDKNVDFIDYFSFVKYSGLSLPDNEFQPDFLSEYNDNKTKYEKVFDALSDEESKRQFEKIINFRVNLDLKYLEGFTNKEKVQYFEDFLGLSSEGEVFVDAGGFDGYTTSEFIKRCPSYKKVYLFEPELTNLQTAKKNLKSFSSIDFFPIGLFSEKTSFKFESGGSASRITNKGSFEIKVDKLDSIINDKVTFIKMDIEGAELDAILGAKELIRKYKPKLAISAYHKKDDFWKIPELVLSIRSDYKIYFRHYMEGVTETVMFFI